MIALCLVSFVGLFSIAFARLNATDFVAVPGGHRIHSSCVHGVPHNTLLVEANGVLIAQHPNGTKQLFGKCAHALPKPLHGPAWKAWGQFTRNEGLTLLSNSWKALPVPSQPNNGQLLYLWNGLEPNDASAVIQPVLQYGEGPAGPTNPGQWGIASWYVSGEYGAVYSNLIPVRVGQTVVGTTSRPGAASTTWNIAGIVRETGQSSVLKYTTHRTSYNIGYVVLEAYNVESECGDYPPQNQLFYNFTSRNYQGKNVIPTWTAMTKDAECNEHATFSGTNVTIHFS